MSIKTVTLETAKLLEDNGFPYKESFAYCIHSVTGGRDYIHLVWDGQGITSCGTQYRKVYAPTTDELLEELPKILNGFELRIIGTELGTFNCCYWESRNYDERRFEVIEDESLPEALAQMWLHLKKEGLLNDSIKRD